MRTLVSLLVILSFIACNDTDRCTFPDGPVVPTGYGVATISSTDTTSLGAIEKLQMMDAQIGYALHGNHLYRTENGGMDWTQFLLPTSHAVEDFIFTDAQTGYFTNRINNETAALLKTTDGGESFAELSYANFDRYFSTLTADSDGSLYAEIGGYGEGSGIARSTDAGATFTHIYSADALYINELTAHSDRLYFLEGSEFLKIATLQGEVLHSRAIGNTGGVEQLLILNDEEYVLAGQYFLDITTDSGMHWDRLYDDEVSLLGGSAESGALLLLDKDYCGDDPSELSAFAVLDGNLRTGPLMRDFYTYGALGAYIGDGRWLVVYEEAIFVVREE